MAQKIKRPRRSLVTHERNPRPNERMAEFIENLFDGKIDEDIEKMMAAVPEAALRGFTPIQDLIEEMKTLVNRPENDTLDTLDALNHFINAHDTHPQSLLLLQAISQGLGGLLDPEIVAVFKAGIMNNIGR